MDKKDKLHKHSPARLYKFQPDEATITPNNVVELTKVIQIGVNGDTLKVMSPELQKHFKEVA